VGKVAYKLDLPSDAKIHPVVHVSLLKQHVPAHIQVSADLTALPSDDSSELSPIAVLDSRCVHYGSTPKSEWLIQWSGWPSSWSTWEETHDIRRRYPDAPAWGQAGFEGGGNVMTRPVSG
jgi:hypothetical protein